MSSNRSAKKNSRPRPRSISTSRPRPSTPIPMSRSRSQSRNISRYEPHEKIMQDLMKENERLKGLLKLNDEKEVKTSMNGLNKMVDIDELKKELDELRKRDEFRTRMLTEDLRAFEEKRQEIILIQEKRIDDGTWGRLDPRVRYNEEDKMNYMKTVIDHLKLLIGISPRDLCINNIADDLLERTELFQRRGGGVRHPYQLEYNGIVKMVTREEFIDGIKKGKAHGYEDLDNLCINDMKKNLLIKTIHNVGTRS